MIGAVLGIIVCVIGIALALSVMWRIIRGRPIAIGFMIPHRLGREGRIVVFLVMLMALGYFVLTIVQIMPLLSHSQ